MRIAFLSSFYYKHCLQIYSKHKYLDKKSYREQEKIIENETICSMGQWPYYFQNEGWETLMLCRNNPFLQSKWCEENDFIPSSDDPEFEIIKEQVKRFKPEILFAFGASYYNEQNRLEELVQKIPTIKKKICWYGAPEGKSNIFNNYDLVLTNSLELRDSLRNNEVNSEQLNHAFEPEVLNLIKKKPKVNKICFMGSLIPGNKWHTERLKYLEKLSNIIDIDIYSDMQSLGLKNLFLKKAYILRQNSTSYLSRFFPNNSIIQYYGNPKNLPDFGDCGTSSISPRLKSPLFGIDMLQKLSEYTLTFNLHVKETGNCACNMRLFEATGVGTSLLSDYKKNSNQLFENNREITNYTTITEVIDRTKYLLENPKHTKSIADAGQLRTLNEHTTEKQVVQLMYFLNQL
ncbi:glycosyltransferase [Opitutales bacterium]|nr:glycosyltransferase [Opitutales bacterium]